jgi:hypothetical protein
MPRRVFALFATVMLGVIALNFGAAERVALADCNQNIDRGIFTDSSAGLNVSRGSQADILVKSPPEGACAGGSYIGEGTAHQHISGSNSGDFAEIGWISLDNGFSIDHYLFWETSFNSNNSGIHAFTSGCATPGTTTTFRVGNKSGTQEWAMSYACNGGGFTQIKLSGNLGANNGDARGEMTHHSNPVPQNGLDDHFTELKYRDNAANWNYWGGVICDQPGAIPNGFKVNVINGHEYYTGDGSPNGCP